MDLIRPSSKRTSLNSVQKTEKPLSSKDLPPSLSIKIFLPAMTVVLAAGVFMLFDGARAADLVSRTVAFITHDFGWLFTLTGFGAFCFALWLAFGRYGHVKLAGGKYAKQKKPEYGEASWASMMFTAGIGIGLVSWSFVEPVFYLQTPPLGIAPNSPMAFEWGHMYAQFHWSFVPWALYAIASVPVAYAVHVRQRDDMRLGASVADNFSGKKRDAVSGLVDTLVIIGLVGGAGTSLGLGVPLVAAFLSDIFGVADTFLLRLIILVVWAGMFSFSVWRGLKRGIRLLADLNIGLAILILALVLVAGPTVFIVSVTTNSFGLLLDNFLRMSFWLDPIEAGGFPESWTLFYWAWWVAYAPMMGLFFGRISRGRTIRHMVLGILGWGSLGCMAFMSICGAYALYLEMEGVLSVSSILSEHGMAATVLQIIKTLPFPGLVSVVFLVLAFLFLATTLDSAAYVLASVSTKNLKASQEPKKWNRLSWALALAFLSVGLIYIDALSIVQGVTIITALPLVPVLVLVCMSLVRWLKQDFGAVVGPETLVLDDSESEYR